MSECSGQLFISSSFCYLVQEYLGCIYNTVCSLDDCGIGDDGAQNIAKKISCQGSDFKSLR